MTIRIIIQRIGNEYHVYEEGSSQGASIVTDFSTGATLKDHGLCGQPNFPALAIGLAVHNLFKQKEKQ